MSVHTSKGIDYVADWIFQIDDLVPPFCVEVVLKDRHRFYLHSVASKDVETKSLVLRIWDLRAFSDNDLDDLRTNLNSINSRKELNDEQKIHPKLDWANLRLNIKDIAYCVEWHDRIWPEDERPKIGF